MRMSWPLVCVAALILVGFNSGCSASGKTAPAMLTPDAGDSFAQGDGIHEYRAVCAQKNLHNGNEVVLTRWLDTRAKAKEIGDYHSEFKYKGHSVRIEERVKAKSVEPPR